jgi:hypothetical protein
MKTILIFLAFASSLHAEDFTFNKETGKTVPNYVGELKILKGSAYKQNKNGRVIPIKIGARFYKDDTIVTKNKSYLRVIIVDDTVLNLGSNTEMNFEEFKFSDKTDRQMTLNLIKGQIRSMVQNKAKEHDIVFKTRSAAVGIRGTEVLVNYQSVKNLDISEFALIEGTAEVTDNKGQKQIIQKADRVIVVHDSSTNEMGLENKLLSEEISKSLLGDEALLPYAEIDSLNTTHKSWLSKEKTAMVQETSKSEVVKEEAQQDGAGLDEKLEKLNGILRKSRQR